MARFTESVLQTQYIVLRITESYIVIRRQHTLINTLWKVIIGGTNITRSSVSMRGERLRNSRMRWAAEERLL